MSAERALPSESDFVEAIARRVVDLLREEAELVGGGPRLMTVAQVREEFGVSADWLYSNADRFGAIRLGTGPRACLRFDRGTIAARIACIGSGGDRKRPSRRARKVSDADCDAGLLPIRD